MMKRSVKILLVIKSSVGQSNQAMERVHQSFQGRLRIPAGLSSAHTHVSNVADSALDFQNHDLAPGAFKRGTARPDIRCLVTQVGRCSHSFRRGA